MKNVLAFGFAFALLVKLGAQQSATPVVMGENHFIASKILEETRQIQIHLPENYDKSNDEYPVLYLLDGQRFFGHAVGLGNTFAQFRLAPDFITVGINTSYPKRFTDFSRDADKFIDFMKTELLPYVQNNFRTTDEKLFFGWEYGGSLGFQLILADSVGFNGYLLASPFPIKENVDRLGHDNVSNTSLYFSVSPDEYEVNHGTEKLDSLLSTKKLQNLEWNYAKLLNEEHRSTGYTTLYHGLRHYFKYYPEFQEDNLQKFLNAGGLAYAYNHTKERGRRYGLSDELSTWSMYTIIRSAIRANDYNHFQKFTAEFVTDEFIRELKNRALDISSFYSKHRQFNEAIAIYELLLLDYPDSERLLRLMGETYEEKGQNREAAKYFKRAAHIASKSKDR